VIRRNVQRVLPYMLTEPILMKAAALGRDRQQLHEAIRKHSHEVTRLLKSGAAENDLLKRLEHDPLFAGIDMEQLQREAYLTGRAEQQIEEFLASEIAPVRQRYAAMLGQKGDVRV
jgi:adenylosuccinate lyase